MYVLMLFKINSPSLSLTFSDDGGEAQRHRTGERHAQGQPQRRGIGESRLSPQRGLPGYVCKVHAIMGRAVRERGGRGGRAGKQWSE